MVAKPKGILISIGVLLLAILACQPGPPPPLTPAGDSAALTLTSVIQTLSALTASAPVGDASATLPANGIPTATELLPILDPTASPIINIPTLIVVPSPTVPMVSVTTGTNCRTGPGAVYDKIGGAPEGVKFVLIGKNTSTNYWIIRLQDGRECWLWGQYAVVEGNVASLPEYAIPPTPLPPVGSITVTVKDFGGDLVPGATVVAELSQRTAASRGNGTYSLDNLPAIKEYITVEASNFAPAHRSVNIVHGSTSTVEIKLRGTSLPSGGGQTVEGRVLVNSSPAAGVTVWAWRRGQPVTTDNNGRYRIELGISIGYDDILVLAQSGTMRGAVEVVSPLESTVFAPDLILLPR